MCAHNVFIFLFFQFWFFYDCLTILRRVSFFTACSVDVGDFLSHTQYTQEIFYRILSNRRRFFTAYSVDVGDFLPHTQQAWNNFENLPSCCTLSTQQTLNDFYRILSTRRRFFTAYSVHVGDFLPPTQYTQHNFCRSLSRRGIFFSAHSVSGKKPKWLITA